MSDLFLVIFIIENEILSTFLQSTRDERKWREIERRRMREDDRRWKKDWDGEKTRESEREDLGVKPVASTPIKVRGKSDRTDTASVLKSVFLIWH